MKFPLSKLVICVTGDFGSNRTYDDMKRWIEQAGGRITKQMSMNVTHLVCTKTAWTKQNPVVQAANKRKLANIVSYDWLEDSLHARICRAVSHYCWTRLESRVVLKKPRRMAEKVAHKQGASEIFRAGQAQSHIDVLSENHHIYRDQTGFLYNIVLNRADVRINRNERYQLALFENNVAPPFFYACAVSFSAPGGISRSYLLTPGGSQYITAFGAFRKFFKAKTGVDWDMRMYNEQTQQLKSHEKMEIYPTGSREGVGQVPDLTLKEKNKGKKTRYFTYNVPDVKKGEPLGEMALMRQAVEKRGKPAEEFRQVGGQASDDEMEYDDE